MDKQTFIDKIKLLFSETEEVKAAPAAEASAGAVTIEIPEEAAAAVVKDAPAPETDSAAEKPEG